MNTMMPSMSQISHQPPSASLPSFPEYFFRSGNKDSNKASFPKSFFCHLYRSSLASSVVGVQIMFTSSNNPPGQPAREGAAMVLIALISIFRIRASSGDSCAREWWPLLASSPPLFMEALCNRQSNSNAPGSCSNQRWCRKRSSICGCRSRFVPPSSKWQTSTSIANTLRSSFVTLRNGVASESSGGARKLPSGRLPRCSSR
mmetsp:Transcript_68506/g.135389  ORF Transcript_68506/g.135389 Transcript_68506/m.135389 type:complete len:202 (-) Transcript_68506:222-827(-)